MPDNINKTADSKELENKELDIEQLEDVSGGGLFDQLKNAAGQQWSESKRDKS
jgi:hypothetical protein